MFQGACQPRAGWVDRPSPIAHRPRPRPLQEATGSYRKTLFGHSMPSMVQLVTMRFSGEADAFDAGREGRRRILPFANGCLIAARGWKYVYVKHIDAAINRTCSLYVASYDTRVYDTNPQVGIRCGSQMRRDQHVDLLPAPCILTRQNRPADERLWQ